MFVGKPGELGHQRGLVEQLIVLAWLVGDEHRGIRITERQVSCHGARQKNKTASAAAKKGSKFLIRKSTGYIFLVDVQ
jgi:hypothetical protein